MMKYCAVKTWFFLTAFVIGAAGWAVFQSPEGFEARSFEDAASLEVREAKHSATDERLLAALRKQDEKELERLVRMKIFTAGQAAETRKQMFDPNPEAVNRRIIALIDARCRREGFSSFQCLTRKEVAAFDIEKNVLPRYDSFSGKAGYNGWRRKRKMEKQAAEVLFDANAGSGKM